NLENEVVDFGRELGSSLSYRPRSGVPYLTDHEDCSDSFPSKQGLTNHVRNHRRRDSLQAAEVPLPAPATRQRTRAHPTVRPVCGGDARVPAGEMVEVTEDMPRILDGNRPPDTGLVFVYRFLLPSQRQPSQGYRLVIELVNLPGWASWGSSSTPRSAHLCIYPVGVRDTRFMLQGSPLRPLAEGKAATFLGAQVGFNVVPPLSTLAEIIYIGLRIARSMLAPWQRIDALKTFYYPSTVHLQRLGVLPKTDWARVDSILRTEIKKTLYLPQEASGEYLYGSTRRGGGFGYAFKLITFLDQRVAEDAAEHVEKVTKRRISKELSIHEVGAYLSGKDEGVARNASKRLSVKWSLDGAPSVAHEGMVMGRKQRRAVMRTIRDTLRLKRSNALIAKPDQGRAVKCVAAHAASTHFLREGDFTRFADWRFVHRARLNLVPLNGSSSWRAGDRRCRRCGYLTESLSHVVDHCMRYTALYLARHNAIVARIKKVASTKFEVLSENQALGNQGLRPDLVLKKGPNIYVVDVTVPFVNRLEAFKAAAAVKTEKYEQLRVDLAAQHRCDAIVVPFIVGALGSWDSTNDEFMRALSSRCYATLMRKLCVSDTVSITRDIYIEHLSGVRQIPPNIRFCLAVTRDPVTCLFNLVSVCLCFLFVCEVLNSAFSSVGFARASSRACDDNCLVTSPAPDAEMRLRELLATGVADHRLSAPRPSLSSTGGRTVRPVPAHAHFCEPGFLLVYAERVCQ
ncbi:Retrovirus-related Pol polyprotein from type-2 retrotransposable element R2DM, partial [Aphis craccivora]